MKVYDIFDERVFGVILNSASANAETTAELNFIDGLYAGFEHHGVEMEISPRQRALLEKLANKTK